MIPGRAAFILALLLPISVRAQGVQVYDARPTDSSSSNEKSTDDSAPEVEVSNSEDDFAELEKDLAAQSKALGVANGLLESPEEKRDRLDAEEAAKQDEPEGEGVQLNSELMELQKALKGGKTSLDVLKEPALRNKLIAAYEKNPMVGMPREILKGMIGTQVQKTPLGPFVKTFPKLLDFLVDLMRHPRALAQAVKVLNRMDDLKKCGYVSIGLMIFVFFLRKKIITKRTKFFKRIFLSLATSALMVGGSIGFLWMSFREELGPSWEVFRQTFF